MLVTQDPAQDVVSRILAVSFPPAIFAIGNRMSRRNRRSMHEHRAEKVRPGVGAPGRETAG